MKFLFSNCVHCSEEEAQIKLGVNWFKHIPPTNTKLFKSWRGFTITFYLIWYRFDITIVDDYAAYQNRINYRFKYVDRLSQIKEKKNVN